MGTDKQINMKKAFQIETGYFYKKLTLTGKESIGKTATRKKNIYIYRKHADIRNRKQCVVTECQIS